jgi:hypothetical protein
MLLSNLTKVTEVRWEAQQHESGKVTIFQVYPDNHFYVIHGEVADVIKYLSGYLGGFENAKNRFRDSD